MFRACQSILKVVSYFDVFQYPVKKEEIISFLDSSYPEITIDAAIEFLVEKEIIYRQEEFYMLQNNYLLITRRKEGNEKAIRLLAIAKRMATLLSGFPYVRGVAVSGSLSKNFADEKADIDFFIIAKSNRLWIARTLMHLFKKLTFLVGRQHWFCMNYYIDESSLQIREKNIFTATEVVTAMPMRGKKVVEDFRKANGWVYDYFPLYVNNDKDCRRSLRGPFKIFAEWIFNNRFGNWLDDKLMNVTVRRWKKKTQRKKLNSHGILMGMDAGKHYSKPIPGHLQEKVVRRFNLKMEQLMMELESLRTASAV